MSDLYDYDSEDVYYNDEYDQYREQQTVRDFDPWHDLWSTVNTAPFAPLEKEMFLRWEHELSQANYYDYFLEEVTR